MAEAVDTTMDAFLMKVKSARVAEVLLCGFDLLVKTNKHFY